MAPLVPLTGIAAAPTTPVAVDLDVLPWPSPGDSNPTQLLCGRRAELRFTVRRPPAGEVSPCCHRPSGGDVACSVHVGVAPASIAGLALEDRLALAVSGCDVPARGASLRRVRSRDLFNPAESLVLQPCDQLAPATSHDCAVEPALLGDSRARLLDGPARRPGHRPHVKSLDPDHLEPSRQVGGGLLDPVLAPIPLTGLQSAIARFVSSRRLEPRLPRPSRCCNTFNRFDSPAVKPGTCSSSPVDSAADTATPRSMPTTLQSLGPQIGSGRCANAICQRPARSRVIR